MLGCALSILLLAADLAPEKTAKKPPPPPAAAASAANPAPAAPATKAAPAAPAAPKVRKVETQRDAAPAKATAPAASARAAGPQVGRFSVAARVGLWIPRTELEVGPLFAAEVAYRPPLPVLEDRILVAFSAGFAATSHRSEKIVVGRGLDRSFVQNTRIVPLELSATIDLLARNPRGLSIAAGLGLGLYPTFTRFISFGTPSDASSAGGAVFAVARGSVPLGPGRALLDLRYAEARASLGPLGDVGTSDLSALTVSLGYGIDL